LLSHEEIVGPVNLTAPHPLPNRDFMRELRRAWGIHFGLPSPAWMLEIGAVLLGTETELILKSRRAVPSLLLQHGFRFEFPRWSEAAAELVKRYRARGEGALRQDHVRAN
jgi:NAD dependent epimerase/dehydratase family enzyme